MILTIVAIAGYKPKNARLGFKFGLGKCYGGKALVLYGSFLDEFAFILRPLKCDPPIEFTLKC